jgi:hypothetical protein
VCAGVEVDALDACGPAPLAAVARLHFFDETVTAERAQVIAARRRALADGGSALGGGRVTLGAENAEQPESRGVAERAQRGGRGQAR